MGSFSDDDLKRLKESIANGKEMYGEVGKEVSHDLDALLARLKAAETAVEILTEVHVMCTNSDCAEVLETWRKAAGK